VAEPEAPVYKWGVRVYEKGAPHYRKDEKGHYHDLAVWHRQYYQEASLRRALPWLKRTYPDHDIQVTRYRNRLNLFWAGDMPRLVGVDYP
jgi:hypothetical protein